MKTLPRNDPGKRASAGLICLASFALFAWSCQAAPFEETVVQATPERRTPASTPTRPSATRVPTEVPSQTPSAPSTATIIPADSFPIGSIARAVAGSTECRLPCWNGLIPGRSTKQDLDSWLTSEGLGDAVKRTEGGTHIYVSGANPGNMFLGPLDLQFHVSPERLSSITIDELPFDRTVSEELRDFTLLLGSPDIISASEIQGVYPPTVDLTLVYLSNGTSLTYLADLTQVSLGGRLTDAICLAKTPRRDATLYIATDLSFMSDNRFDWSRRIGMPESELIDALTMGDGCVRMYP